MPAGTRHRSAQVSVHRGLTEGEAERVCGGWLDFYWCGSSSG